MRPWFAPTLHFPAYGLGALHVSSSLQPCGATNNNSPLPFIFQKPNKLGVCPTVSSPDFQNIDSVSSGGNLEGRGRSVGKRKCEQDLKAAVHSKTRHDVTSCLGFWSPLTYRCVLRQCIRVWMVVISAQGDGPQHRASQGLCGPTCQKPVLTCNEHVH